MGDRPSNDVRATFRSILNADPKAILADGVFMQCSTGIASSFDQLKLYSWKLSSQKSDKVFLEWKSLAIDSVSVISAVFNPRFDELEAFINSVIRSFTHSLIKDRELVLVNDGSARPEDIDKFLARLRPNLEQNGVRLKYISKPRNEGPAIARNVGIENASSDFVLIVDSDDTIHPLYIQILGQELLSGSEWVTSDLNLNHKSTFVSIDRDLSELAQRNGCASCIGFNRRTQVIRDLIESGGVYTGDPLSHYEDWELNLVLKGLGLNLSVVPMPLYNYRVSFSGRNLSQLGLRKFAEFDCFLSAWRRLNRIRPGGSHTAACVDSYDRLLRRAKFPFIERNSMPGYYALVLKHIANELGFLLFGNYLFRVLMNLQRVLHEKCISVWRRY